MQSDSLEKNANPSLGVKRKSTIETKIQAKMKTDTCGVFNHYDILAGPVITADPKTLERLPKSNFISRRSTPTAFGGT